MNIYLHVRCLFLEVLVPREPNYMKECLIILKSIR